jgi:hypothetical protein
MGKQSSWNQNDYIDLFAQYQLMINVRMIQVHYAHMRTYHFCI